MCERCPLVMTLGSQDCKTRCTGRGRKQLKDMPPKDELIVDNFARHFINKTAQQLVDQERQRRYHINNQQSSRHTWSCQLRVQSRKHTTGYWVLGTGYWVLGTGYWVLGTGYWVLSTGHWVLVHLRNVQYWVAHEAAIRAAHLLNLQPPGHIRLIRELHQHCEAHCEASCARPATSPCSW
jgi:hypothetical protein